MPKLIELALAPEKAADPAAWHAEAIRLSGIPGNEIKSVNLRKRSIDARSKHVLVRMQVEIRTISDGSDNKSEILSLQQVQDAPSVVIAGCGPAGMFAALRLIECGIKPIIVERGKPVRERRRDLAQLNRERVVNPDSNYCFGEGGAGTLPKHEQPRWTGQDLKDKTILVIQEQGLGDTIQFIRFIFGLHNEGARVILQVNDNLAPLFAGSPVIHKIVDVKDTPEDFDYWTPIMSIPGVMGVTLENLPHQLQYLSARGDLAKFWQDKLGPKKQLRVGVCWSGRPDSWIKTT